MILNEKGDIIITNQQGEAIKLEGEDSNSEEILFDYIVRNCYIERWSLILKQWVRIPFWDTRKAPELQGGVTLITSEAGDNELHINLYEILPGDKIAETVIPAVTAALRRTAKIRLKGKIRPAGM